ncbi:UBX domain-containing protein 4-like isoform X2 [Asterias rubens]|uniref:UBX domain-containing protein 4-like isoform X2 n=1 Tax=Asterias rubens TaxID=7604 RepID=UPI00145578C7|nr:UBX domain-containing protein 4-like isoform X2 [Asterias rubens]
MHWFEGSITAAITAAKQKRVLFVVYVRGEDDVSKQMDTTWADEGVSQICTESGMIVIRFNSDSDECKQFSQYYPVICVPCVSFISGETGIPLEGAAGYVNASDFKQKIQAVLQMASTQSTSSPVAGTSGQSPAASSTSSKRPSSTPSQPMDTVAATDTQKKELSKLEKAAKLRQKMEEIHQQKEKQKADEAKMKEIERRKVGQAVQQSSQERAEKEARRLAGEIRKEKEEDRLAKERIREQIARDRAEKQSKYDVEKKERLKTKEAASEAAKIAASEAPKRKINMDVARIQFRLPDGSTLMKQFDAKAPLQEAQDFLMQNIGSAMREFTMSTTFPRRRFSSTNMNSTFVDLDLVPTAAIIVVPGRLKDIPAAGSPSSAASKSGSSLGFFTMLLAPLIFLWNVIYNFLFGRPSQPEVQAAQSRVPVEQTAPSGNEYAQSSTGARPKSSQVRRRNPGAGGSSSRQEGNIHRLATVQNDDDDDNNTWNGNSTQQM